MDKLREATKRAEEVERLLENDHLRAAWEDTEQEIIRMWYSTKSTESDTREQLYREYHGLQAAKARLKRVVNEGKKADHELKLAEKQNGRVRSA